MVTPDVTNFCNRLSVWPDCSARLPVWFDGRGWLFPAALIAISIIALIWPSIAKRFSFQWPLRRKGQAEPATNRERAALVSSISLTQGLYVAEILLSLDRLASDRRTEISIRLYNATSKTVLIENIVGTVSVGIRQLPPPILVSPADRRIPPFREPYYVVLHQAVPRTDADFVLKLIEDGLPVSFYFDDLNISIRDEADGSPVERLKLWDGLTIERGIHCSRHVNLSGSVTAHRDLLAESPYLGSSHGTGRLVEAPPSRASTSSPTVAAMSSHPRD
jgi:hypothetical protein